MRSETLNSLWKNPTPDLKLTFHLSLLSVPHSNQISPFNGLSAHCASSLCPGFLFHLVWNVLSHHFLKACPLWSRNFISSIFSKPPGLGSIPLLSLKSTCKLPSLHSQITSLLFLPVASSTQWPGAIPLKRPTFCQMLKWLLFFILLYINMNTKARKVWLHLLTSHFTTTPDRTTFWSHSLLSSSYTDLTVADRML